MESKIKIDPAPDDRHRVADLLDVVLAQIHLSAICETASKMRLAERVWQIPDEQYLRRINQERGETILS